MYRILYVDDETGLLEICKIFLEQRGDFSVETLTSATEALELLNTIQFDAIISDYLMPGMDGIEFLKMLRASGNTIPFVIFTGRGREEVVINALNSGADFYLQKGGDPASQFAELAHKIRQAVSRKQAEEAVKESEQRLSDIIDFLPDATFAIDTGGHVIAWNKAIEEMTGVAARDIIGKGNYEYSIPFYGDRHPILIDLVSVPDDEFTRRKYSNIKKVGNVLIAETSLPRPKGRYSILMGKASILYDRKGAVVGAIESIRDITESRSTEVALQESERKYRTLAEAALDPIFIIGPDDTVLYVNTRAALMLNRSAGQIIGKPRKSLFPPDIADDQGRDLQMVFTNGMPLRKEARILYGDTEYWQDNSLVPLKNENGNVTAVLWISHDITRRKRMEEALRESEKKFRNVFDWANDAILLHTLTTDKEPGRFIDVNQIACSMLGYSREELLVMGPPDIVPQELHPQLRDMIRQAQTKNTFLFESRIRRKDGTTFPVESSVHLVNYEGMRIWISHIRDITERKRAEEALRESESRLSLALDVGNAGIWEWNLERNDISLNDRFHAMLGYTPGELPTTLPEWLTYHHPEDIPVWTAKAEAYLRGDTPMYESEHRIRTKAGNWARVFTRGQVVNRTATGTPKLIMGIAMNVTKHREAEAAVCETEQRFHAVFDAARDGMLVADPETHRFIMANASILMQTGYTEAELLSRSMSDIHPQADLPYVIEQFEKQNHGEINLSSDVPVLRKDGTVFFADINSSAVTLQGRQYLLGIFRDMTERKQMEKKLRENEERLIKAQAIGHTGSWEYNLQTGKIWGSAEGARIYGLKQGAGDFPVDEIEACIPERERVHQALVDLIQEGKEYNLEFAINPADGSDQKVIISLAGLEKDAQGNAIRVIGVIQDITDRKRAEEEILKLNRDLEQRVEERTNELRHANEELIGSEEALHRQLDLLAERDKLLTKSEERYRTVADFTYDWESWIAPDGTFLYVSPSCERITGYRPEEFIHDPDLLATIAHTTDDRDKMIDHHSLVKDCCREPISLEFQIVTKNGEVRWIDHKCQPVYNPRGEYLGLRCSNRDITGRKQADKVLRETMEYLNNLFNYANAPIIVWDKEFRITRFNHAFEHLTGRIERDVLGQPLDILFPADSRDASLALIKKTLEGEHWETVEIPILTKDGRVQTALWNSANILDETGKIISTIAQGMDITERKKMSTQIEASLTEKKALLKEVHHRVKNNLQIIASVLNLQIRKIDDPSTIEALKDCQGRVRSMALVHEHLYRGKDLSHVDLGNYIRALGTVLFNSYDARERGVRFELDIHDIYVDTNTAIPLGLISNELITNSLKYAFKEKEGGKLSITATEDSTTLIFVVADNGIGMAPDITLENQTSLGLQLVSSLTDQLNGTVAIDRTGGTKFTFTFLKPAENKGKAGP